MDRKSIVAILVCFVFYLGYEFYLNQKYPDRYKPQNQQVTSSTPLTPSEPKLASPLEAASEIIPSTAAPLTAEELTISNDVVTYTFEQETGGFFSILLKDYQNEERTAPMQILNDRLLVQGRSALTPSSSRRLLEAKRSDRTLNFAFQEGPWLIRQSYTIPEHGYGADISISWENQTSSAQNLTSYVLMQETISFTKKRSGFLPGVPTGRPAIIYSLNDKTSWKDVEEYCEADGESLAADMQAVDFVGFDKHYFLKLLIPESKKSSYQVAKALANNGRACQLSQWLSLPQGEILPQQSLSLHYKAWFGPKQSDQLEAYHAKLANTLDLGMFSLISKPLFYGLKGLRSFFGNWGLAIIALTLLLKILFYPLTRQAAIAQNRMKQLQPEMNKIKERYKDDAQRQQQEIMRFMATNKVNPFKGCLPILPQIPVFIAFYRVLSASIELRHAPFYGWITDLSVADPYYITPLVLGVTMLVQQKLMPTTGLDKTQERIMMMLPLVFTIMMLTLPAGMVLYMLTNTLVSIAQQQWLNKRLT